MSRRRRTVRCWRLAAPRPHLIVLVQRRGCVHGPDRGIVDLGLGQRLGRETERPDFGDNYRRRGSIPSQRDEGQRDLPLHVEVQQPVHLGVHEAAHDPCRDLKGRRGRQQVSQNRARVPEAVSIGPGLVFPRVAPVRPGTDDDRRRGGGGRLARGRLHDGAPVISSAQLSQCEVVHPEVIDPGLQIRQVTADEIQLDVIERARTGGGAKQDLSPVNGPPSGDTCGEEQDPREGFQIRDAGASRIHPRGRDGSKSRHCGGREVAGQRDGLKCRIHLEEQRLVRPVKKMGTRAHALGRSVWCRCGRSRWRQQGGCPSPHSSWARGQKRLLLHVLRQGGEHVQDTFPHHRTALV